MIDYKKYMNEVNGIPGWMNNPAQAAFMGWLGLTSDRAAEIGSCYGLSAAIVGLGMKSVRGVTEPWYPQYYCVDTFGGIDPEQPEDCLSVFRSHMERLGLEAICMPVVGSSRDEATLKMVDGDLDWLYVDGDHSFDGCLSDLRMWVPKVKRNGLVLVHDIDIPEFGVARAVAQAIRDGLISEVFKLGADCGVYRAN